MSALTSYGRIAKLYSASFSDSDPVIVFDHEGAAEAARDAAVRRARNKPFAVRVLIAREYAMRSDAVSGAVLNAFHGADEQRNAFEQSFAGVLSVNGQPLQTIAPYTAGSLRLMQATLRLADELIVSSESERRRIQELVLSDPLARTVRLVNRLAPPRRADAQCKDAIVIWAPQLSGDAAAAFGVALSDFRLPLVVVGTESLRASLGIDWVSVDDAERALTRAKVIVDVDPYGCDSAPALATYGVPLVADVESGAQEILRGVKTFDRRRYGSLFDAVAAALGSASPQEIDDRQPLRAITPPSLLESGPLVSVIIPTFDRPKMLEIALNSIVAQTYQNIEAIVVIDGGPNLEAVEARFPTAKFIYMSENDLPASANRAFDEARGEYIAFLNDDDIYFPNHVASLVTALERSKASVAHSDVLTGLLRGNDECWTLYGLESNMSRAASLSTFLTSNQIGLTSCMFRKSCVSGALLPHPDLLYVDYELWLRLATEYDFVHVDRITSCYTIRNDGSSQQSNSHYDKAASSYRAIYELYPLVNRPLLLQRRNEMLARVSTGDMRLNTEPAGMVQPVPWPLCET